MRTRRSAGATVVRLPLPERGRRRWRWWMAAAVLAAGLAAAGAGWRVGEVRVTGTEALSPDLVLQASGIGGGEPFLLTRMSSIRERVTRLPAVRDAEVRRAFPSAVVVEVSERRPLFRLVEEPQLAVDEEGRMFGVPDHEPLPVLTGQRARPSSGGRVDAAAARVLAAYARFPRELVGEVGHLELGSQVTVTLQTGVRIVFGRPEQLVAKAAAAGAVLEDVRARAADIEYIDVRVPRTPVTKPREIAPPPSG